MALDASSLTAGADYSFGSESGYKFLQTQPFSSSAKRLTVNNSTGPGATHTNPWTVVMDVKFDAFQPYAGLLQFNPTNNTDVSTGGDLKPAKLGSFGFWGEELSAAGIASLGSSLPSGLASPSLTSTIATAAPYVYGANVGWIHTKPAENGDKDVQPLSKNFLRVLANKPLQP